MTTFTDKELIKEIKERISSLDVRDNIERRAYEIALASLEAEPVSQTYNLPELIEGMEVSIDVSTCDADLGNRYFGTVTEALELDTAKNGYILLVQDAEPNFDVNGNYPDIPDSSVPAPGKGVTGERIRIKPHVYRELVNRLHDTAIKCAGTQQLRERISRVLGDVITPDHHKQAEKSGLERCRLEAALNIKPGHTLGIIDALLVHKMARALLPLVAEKHEVDHANES